MPGKPVIERVSDGIVLKRVKLFATCLVFDQGSGFMDCVKEIFLIPQFTFRFIQVRYLQFYELYTIS